MEPEIPGRLGRKVRAYRARDARLLPTLDYNTGWSWDRSERTYMILGNTIEKRFSTQGDTRWQVKPRADGQFDRTVFNRDPSGNWNRRTECGRRRSHVAVGC